METLSYVVGLIHVLTHILENVKKSPASSIWAAIFENSDDFS